MKRRDGRTYTPRGSPPSFVVLACIRAIATLCERDSLYDAAAHPLLVRRRTCHFALSSAFWRFALNPFPLLPLAGNSVLQTDFHPALKLQSRMSPALHCQSGTSAHAKCRAGSQPIQSYSIEHAECNGMCFACSERDHTAATLGPCPVHCACVSTTMRVHTCSRSYVVRWRAAIGRTASNCWTSAWQGDGFER